MKQFYLYKNRGGRVCIDIDPPSGQKEINFFDPPPSAKKQIVRLI